jgi:murein DD-endopeptidase MepM/ murein hydrolase activator NlpD
VRLRGTVACLIAVLLLGTAAVGIGAALQTSPAHALTLGQLEALLQQARSKKKGLDTVVARLDARLSVISDKLQSLNRGIADVTATLDARQAAYDALQAKLTAKKRQLVVAQQHLRWQQMVFAERVVQTYKSGEVDYLAVLLGSNGYEDMISRVSLISDLVRSDNDMVGDLTSSRDTVAAQKREVADQTAAARRLRDEVQRKSDQLAALKADQLATLASTKDARRAKTQALAGVEKSISAWEAQEAVLATESQGLAGVIQGLAGNGDGKATGSLQWPVAGPVTSPFGWRIHPIFHVRKFHTGIDIGAGYGTPIHAADGGRVIYATWMSGYGNTTIIDHGSGISTLYAHQSSVLISSGSVTKGQVIGYVGATGYATGPHLHFEVRVNGNPVNPLGYLH